MKKKNNFSLTRWGLFEKTRSSENLSIKELKDYSHNPTPSFFYKYVHKSKYLGYIKDKFGKLKDKITMKSYQKEVENE